MLGSRADALELALKEGTEESIAKTPGSFKNIKLV